MAWNTSELFQRTFAFWEHSLNRGIESTVENTNGLHCKSESAQVHNVHHGRTKPKNTEIRGKVVEFSRKINTTTGEENSEK